MSARDASRARRRPPHPGRPGRGDERGVALLLVLWIFMTLGVIALDFAKYMRDDAMAAVNMVEETRGYYLAVAGMNRAIYELMDTQERGADAGGFLSDGFFSTDREKPTDENQPPGPTVPPDGQWHDGDFQGGKWRVRITDEGGKIAINRIGEPLLTTIFTNLLRGGNRTEGVDRHEQKKIQQLVNAVLDWRDPDSLVRTDGAEDEYYLALRPPYRAKNGFFDAPEELLLVRGMTADLVYGTADRPGLREIFSVFSRSRNVNLRSVTAPVLQALLGVDAETAADLIETRSSDPVVFLDSVHAEMDAVDPGLDAVLVDQAPRIVTVEARADVRQERNLARVAAVMDLDGDSMEGPRVLRWYDRAPWTMDLQHTTPTADAEGDA